VRVNTLREDQTTEEEKELVRNISHGDLQKEYKRRVLGCPRRGDGHCDAILRCRRRRYMSSSFFPQSLTYISISKFCIDPVCLGLTCVLLLIFFYRSVVDPIEV
jgi:hypothetical protein